MEMELWGFERKRAILFGKFQFSQHIAPDHNSREPQALYRQGEGDPAEPSTTWPQNLEAMEECITNANGQIDVGPQGYAYDHNNNDRGFAIGVSINASDLTYQWTNPTDTPTNNHYVSPNDWSNLSFSTNNGRYSAPLPNGAQGTAQYQACRIGPPTHARVFLHRGHQRIRTCDTLQNAGLNPALFHEIPNYDGMTNAEILRLPQQFDQNVCYSSPIRFSSPTGTEYRRRVSVNVDSQAALGALRPMLDWGMRIGGMSPIGVRHTERYGEFTWDTDVHHSDPQALAFSRGLVSLLQGQLRQDQAFQFQADQSENAIKKGAFYGAITAIIASALGAYLMVPDIRNAVNSRVIGAIHGIQDWVARRFGREVQREDPMSRFNGRLDLPMHNLSESAREFIRELREWEARPEIVAWRSLDENTRGEPPIPRPNRVIHSGTTLTWGDIFDSSQDPKELGNIRQVLSREKNASVLLNGPQGDGKTTTAYAFILRAAMGEFGEEWERTNFWDFNVQIIEGQSNQHYNASISGGTGHVMDDLVGALQESYAQGYRNVLFGDEATNWVNAGRHADAHGVVSTQPFIERVKTLLAESRIVRFLATTTTSGRQRLATGHYGPYQDIFGGDSARFGILDRAVRTRNDVMHVATSKLQAFRRSNRTGADRIIMNGDALSALVDTSYDELGSYNTRAVETRLMTILNERLEAANNGSAGWEITRDEVYTEGDARVRTRMNRTLADAFSRTGSEDRPMRVSELVASTIRVAVRSIATPTGQGGRSSYRDSLPYSDFGTWTVDFVSEFNSKLYQVWVMNDNIQACYGRRYPDGSGFRHFVEDAVQNTSVRETLDRGRQEATQAQQIRDAEAALDARTGVRVDPNAQAPQNTTQPLPWREVWGTELGDNESIVRALESTEPELAQLWRDEIASGGRTFSTLGDLIAALEDRNPQFVERAYQALTNGTSTQALTDNPHRALYALLDQTREVISETSSGGRRVAARQTRTFEDRESIFRTSLETVESVSLRSREMPQDTERERRERIDAEARNAHAPSTVRVRN